jgi:hypothetical protein
LPVVGTGRPRIEAIEIGLFIYTNRPFQSSRVVILAPNRLHNQLRVFEGEVTPFTVVARVGSNHHIVQILLFVLVFKAGVGFIEGLST